MLVAAFELTFVPQPVGLRIISQTVVEAIDEPPLIVDIDLTCTRVELEASAVAIQPVVSPEAFSGREAGDSLLALAVPLVLGELPVVGEP